MVVFRREFTRNLLGLAIWGFCIAALTALMVSQYRESAEAAGMANYPEAFIKAMGMDRVDMDTALGYYAGKASVLVTLFGSIYAALLGGGAIVRDESLLARPVSRVQVALERMLAAAANLLILNLVIAVILLACGAGGAVWPVTAAQFLLHLFFAVAGFVIAVARIKAKAALALPLGIALAGYVLSMLYGMAGALDFVKYLTPFYYTDLKDILAGGGLSALHIVIVSAIIIGMASLGTAIYNRKDLPV